MAPFPFPYGENMSEHGPRLYPVIVLNDDTTSFEQVIAVMQYVFNKSDAESTEIANTIHQHSQMVVGNYIHEIAETKIFEVQHLNNLNGMDLQAYIQRDEDPQLTELTRKITDQFKDEPDSDTSA